MRNPIAWVRKWVRPIIGTLILAAVTTFLVSIAWNTQPYGLISEVEAIPAVVVNASLVRKEKAYSTRQEFIGTVEARRESQVGFELSGEVHSISAEEGEFIEKGEIIAKLNTEVLESERSVAIAAREATKARVELAEITLTRSKRLVKQNAISVQEYDDANKGLQAARAELTRAEAAIKTIQTRIDRSILIAPFPALVAERFIDDGQVIDAGTPVFHLLESVEPEVRIGVTGSAIDAIHVGQSYDLIVRKRSVPATVKSVLPVRGNGTRSVGVILTLHTEFNGIRRGDLATLRLDRAHEEEGFWIPTTALSPSSRGLWSCYVAEPIADEITSDATHAIRRRELESIHVEADRVFVRGTVGDDELVVLEGLQRLVPGLPVRLHNSANVLAKAGGAQ